MPGQSTALHDGFCGTCGAVFIDLPDNETNCPHCGKPLGEKSPDSPQRQVTSRETGARFDDDWEDDY